MSEFIEVYISPKSIFINLINLEECNKMNWINNTEWKDIHKVGLF